MTKYLGPSNMKIIKISNTCYDYNKFSIYSHQVLNMFLMFFLNKFPRVVQDVSHSTTFYPIFFAKSCTHVIDE